MEENPEQEERPYADNANPMIYGPGHAHTTDYINNLMSHRLMPYPFDFNPGNIGHDLLSQRFPLAYMKRATGMSLDNDEPIVISDDTSSNESLNDIQEMPEDLTMRASTSRRMSEETALSQPAPDNGKKKKILKRAKIRLCNCKAAVYNREYLKRKAIKERQLLEHAAVVHRKSLEHFRHIHRLSVILKRKKDKIQLKKILADIQSTEEKIDELKSEIKKPKRRRTKSKRHPPTEDM